jgi:dsRNA-specific ribonuclease
VQVVVAEESLGTGTGSSKQQAEKEAARKALAKLARRSEKS